MHPLKTLLWSRVSGAIYSILWTLILIYWHWLWRVSSDFTILLWSLKLCLENKLPIDVKGMKKTLVSVNIFNIGELAELLKRSVVLLQFSELWVPIWSWSASPFILLGTQKYQSRTEEWRNTNTIYIFSPLLF